jgi:hypothetical protein
MSEYEECQRSLVRTRTAFARSIADRIRAEQLLKRRTSVHMPALAALGVLGGLLIGRMMTRRGGNDG